MKKTTFFTLFILCFVGTTHAQFLKKLGEKAGKAAEKAIERKVEQKSKRETEKAFDSTFNKKKKKRKNKKKSDHSKIEPAAHYTFNHHIEMKMETNKKVMNIDYYLSESDDYFGMAIKDKKIPGDFKMVYDVSREAMFTYIINSGQKMKMGVSFKTDENTTTEESKFTIKETGNTKTILGYYCKEYKMTGEDITATIWVTKDVNIRFPSTLYSGDKNKTNTQEWMKDLDGWAMEMTMINTSERKAQTIKMTCLSINTSNLKINSNDYKNIGY